MKIDDLQYNLVDSLANLYDCFDKVNTDLNAL